MNFNILYLLLNSQLAFLIIHISAWYQSARTNRRLVDVKFRAPCLTAIQRGFDSYSETGQDVYNNGTIQHKRISEIQQELAGCWRRPARRYCHNLARSLGGRGLPLRRHLPDAQVYKDRGQNFKVCKRKRERRPRGWGITKRSARRVKRKGRKESPRRPPCADFHKREITDSW